MSGSPGYIKGKPILIGNRESYEIDNGDGSSTTKEIMSYNLNGFPLRGADQDGKCYFV